MNKRSPASKQVQIHIVKADKSDFLPHSFSQGAFALKAWNGIFQNVVAIEFWAYVGEVQSGGYGANIPDIEVSISGKNVSGQWTYALLAHGFAINALKFHYKLINWRACPDKMMRLTTRGMLSPVPAILQGGCSPVRVMSLKPIMFQPNCKPFCTDYWCVFIPVCVPPSVLSM